MDRRRGFVWAALGLAILYAAWKLTDGEAPAPARTAVSKAPVIPPNPIRRAWPSATVVEPSEPPGVASAPSGAGLLEGRVVSSLAGAGIGGAELSFAAGEEAITVTAAADGVFRFEPKEPGDYALAAVQADGHLPFSPAWGKSPIVFRARAGARVTGATIVLDPLEPLVAYVVSGDSKKPVAGARVEVFPAGGLDQSPLPIASVFETNAKGEAEIIALDGAIVEARHPEAGVGRAKIDFRVEVAHRVEIVLAKSEGGAKLAYIAGTVVDEAKRPLEGAHVVVAGDDDSAPVRAATSGEDGRFRIAVDPYSGSRPGKAAPPEDASQSRPGAVYVVSASIEDRAPAEVEDVPPGREDLVLELIAGGSIHGRVTDAATKKPVPAFVVWIARENGPLRIDEYATRVVYDARGEYSVGGIAPGNYVVTVLAEGYAPGRKTKITAGDEASFELARGAKIRGVVRDAKMKAPIVRAKVSLEGPFGDGDTVLRSFMEARTGSEGRFELGGLGPGLHAIFTAAEGHHARITSGLAIAEPDQTIETEVELTPLAENEKAGLELAGIGAVLEPKDTALLVKQALPGGGAAEVGLQPGDLIETIDGVTIVDLGFQGAVQRIRGAVGSSVRLGLRRGDQTLTVDVPRRVVRT